jgi:hypothetical protein
MYETSGHHQRYGGPQAALSTRVPPFRDLILHLMVAPIFQYLDATESIGTQYKLFDLLGLGRTTLQGVNL